MKNEKYEVIVECGKSRMQAIRKLEEIVNFYLNCGYEVIGGANVFDDENGVPYAYQTLIKLE